MSSSEHGVASGERGAPPPRTPRPFSIDSEPMVQISVYDSARTLLGQAEGYLRLALVPGLYRVHLERGGSIHHEIVEHHQDTALRYPSPELQSPAPFHGARTSHDYYVAAAQRYSREDTAKTPLGEGPHTSRLFVFLRREARDQSPRQLPSEPVTIHDAEGQELDAIAPGTAVVDDELGYVAYSRRVKPGTYRLRAARSRRDAAIVVPDGRAALVFIADTGSLQLAELRLALVPSTTGFDPASRTWSAMESLLAALRVPERTLPLAARMLVPEAIEHDLCFGIAAAHVLWRTGDRAGLAAAMGVLTPYREIPDVAILAQLTGSAEDPAASRMLAAVAETLPLLRTSLTTAMTRPELAGTLSAYSGFAQAARTGLHDTVWCVWSTRPSDERWIEPAVERALARDPRRDAASIARSLVLATETVEQAIAAIDAATPGGASARALGPPCIPGYALDAVLGRGPHSTVYRATREADDREVALKLVPIDGGTERCAEALQALELDRPVEHPQLLAATARGRLPDGNGIWLEMELCDGSVLDLVSDEDAPLSPAEAHRIVREAVAVLAHLHAADIAHGDIQPANLLVRSDRSIALASPGLAARRATPAANHASDALRFTTPELRDGGKPSKAADVWAMAAIYYFLLAQDFPRDEYAGQSPYDAMDNNLVPLAQRRPELPRRLADAIDQVLATRDPGQRVHDAAAFQVQLTALDPASPVAASIAAAPSAAPGASDIAAARTAAPPLPPPPPRTRISAVAALARLRALLRPLQGVAPLRAILVVGGVALGGLIWAATRTPESRCEQQIRADEWSDGVETCLATGDPQDQVWAARGYLQLGDLDRAGALARQLVTGPHHADGFAIAADVELRRGQLTEATGHAMHARIEHMRAGDVRGQAGDAVVLSRAAWEAGDFAAARDAAEQALALARRSQDPASITAASLASADALRQLGASDQAGATLTDALQVARGPCSQAALRLSRALCSMDTGHNITARRELDALAEAGECPVSELKSTIALTQAWLLRWVDGRAAAAKLDALAATSRGAGDGSRYFQAFSDVGERLGFGPTDGARGIPVNRAGAHRESAEALLLRAYLAADRGDLAEAEHDLDRASDGDRAGADLRWKIEQARGELAELRGGPLADLLAEYHYRRATTRITASRVAARARSASFVASHRPVYDDLIALLARSGQWRDALAVVLELDLNDLLRPTRDDLARPRSRGPEDRATGVYRAPRAVDAPSQGIDRSRLSVDLLLDAWRPRDLVVLIAPSDRAIGADDERVYRLHVVDGLVTGQDVADTSSARQWADALYQDASDRRPAQALGSAIVPPERTRETLDVLAPGAFSKLPLPALRDPQGALVIAQRPLVRVLGLQTSVLESIGSGPPVVIVDPRVNVLAAVEGAVVAATLAAHGLPARVSGAGTRVPATLDRLREARNARLLHIATRRGGDSPPSLELADGRIDAAELVRAHIAPRLAVLAESATAAAMDDRGSDSPAAGLLRSGTAIVIATARSVTNTASIELMQRFYSRPDWETDPARAFAHVQQALAVQYDADEASSSWAAFSVLGRPPYVAPR
ncbi:MAG TPA: CHAT domain-containing protein [Kofleriaceae bacterium]|nr:CHAT domain-containing protein [Kofleriaceae bacterium]